MKPTRLEAFSDGVIAIIITIMVLELKTPHDPSLAGLVRVLPTLLSYVLNFTIVVIFWLNPHHLIHLAQKVDASATIYFLPDRQVEKLYSSEDH